METKLKLMRTPRARITKNGKMIDIGIAVPVEVIKETYKDPQGIAPLDAMIKDRSIRTVHWKLDALLWDALDKMGLTPTWFGEWTVDIGEIVPNQFTNPRTKEQVTTLQFSVLEPRGSKGGIKIGASDKLEFIDATKAGGENGEPEGDHE